MNLDMSICRNYLDYVEESVADWTKEEEAKYQAHLLSKEIQRMREEEEMASRAAEKRQKSGKRGSSKSIIWASSGQSLSSVFLTKRDSNQSHQLQRQARILKFPLNQV